MKKVLLALGSLVGMSALIVACGSNGGGGGSSPVTTPNSCGTTAGYLTTAQGCLPICNNGANNAVIYQGQCVLAANVPACQGNTGYMNGSCSQGQYGYGGYNGYGTTGMYPNQGYNTGVIYPGGYPVAPYQPMQGSMYFPQPQPLVPGFMGGNIWFRTW